ncbi:transposase [Chryseobacterium lathyri]|uniref:transposase n=1 Tax=Chryseobacterium lathyri TaxID=395933 RepID=UPI00277EB3B4|nr:transposase [Chryseobacterium lathyri]MDQ0064388.1 hypothetical protein [Chryseobacterium lathyri]
MNFKDIQIGPLIEKEVTARGIEISRICNFMKCSEKEIKEMYKMKSMDTEILLKWSKLLKYDLFRLYSQHLILYAPTIPDKNTENNKYKKITLPEFRKSIYTKEVIDFILTQIQSGEMTKFQVIERYRIPKTTLFKWISKYNNNKNK